MKYFVLDQRLTREYDGLVPPSLHEPLFHQWRQSAGFDAPACAFLFNAHTRKTLMCAGVPVEEFVVAQALAITRGMKHVIDTRTHTFRRI